jgi:hsp70-interacting protein
MPDLNELLRWSIANTPAHQETSEPDAQPTEPLTLRFHPAADSGAGTSALHPSDPQYRASHQIEDASPASTPGPVTPVSEVRPRQELNSEILDIIMGKSDSTMMKEKMAYAIDAEMPVDKRIEALDDFEMVSSIFEDQEESLLS